MKVENKKNFGSGGKKKEKKKKKLSFVGSLNYSLFYSKNNKILSAEHLPLSTEHSEPNSVSHSPSMTENVSRVQFIRSYQLVEDDVGGRDPNRFFGCLSRRNL